MRKCDVCGKETGNGVIVRPKSVDINICSKCIVTSDESLAQLAREIIRTGRKSRENGEIRGKGAWAAYWSPDCETPKFRKVKCWIVDKPYTLWTNSASCAMN